MTLQLLISTMNQTDYTLLDKMNVQSAAVVVNQCDRSSVDTFEYNGHSIKWICVPERGIGRSRNTCLMNASADIVLFADDDIRYNDGYAERVLSAFESNSRADVICFNIKLENSTKNIGKHRDNQSCKRLHTFNAMRYGAPLIAARRKALFRERVSFSLIFGGGAEFGSGEDSIFIEDCLKSGLKLYSDTYYLGSVDDSSSSWFKGINDQFYIDRGMAYAVMFTRIRRLIFAYYSIRLANQNGKYNIRRIYTLFIKGEKIFKAYR